MEYIIKRNKQKQIQTKFLSNRLKILFSIALILCLYSLTFAAPPLVDSNLDNEIADGACTLREAIQTVNGTPANGDCTAGTFITFDPSILEIQITSPLPALTASNVTIDGNGLVTLRGAVGTDNGLQIEGANNLITGLTIVEFPLNGLLITGAGAVDNIIERNFIGVAIGDADPALGNGEAGIRIDNGANGTFVGSTNPDDRNTIGNNGTYGIHINGIGGATLPADETRNNTVLGNNIGLNEDGTSPRPNTLDGIRIDNNANTNTIGGTGDNDLNAIAGNLGNGIVITGTSTDTNIVVGNNIGLNLTNQPEPNANGVILSSGASNNTITQNIIQGNAGVGIAIQQIGTNGNNINQNEIRANGQDGIEISGGASGNGIANNSPIRDNGANGIQISDSPNNNVLSNTIRLNTNHGILVTGASAIGNDIESNTIRANTGNGITVSGGATQTTITQNSIHNNDGLGIDLDNDGVTNNDAGDGDTGANDLVNFPALTYAVNNGTNTTFIGTLDAANAPHRLEFFGNNTADPTGFGEGQNYLGVTNGVINSAAQTILGTGATITAGTFVSATTTDNTGSTSEFAQNVIAELLLANFTFTTTSGSLTVPFIDASTGNISAYSWNFGDGSAPVSIQNPTHTFPAAGTYNVTLTVTHVSGLVQSSITQAVTVSSTIPTNTPVIDTPTSTLTPTPITPTATFTVTNTATLTATNTNTPSNTPTFTNTATFTSTPTATFTSSFTPTNTATATFTPSATATNTATFTPTQTATFTATVTNTPQPTSTPFPTSTNSPVPTFTLQPSPTPTNTPLPPEIEIDKDDDGDDTLVITVDNEGGDANNVIVQEILRDGVVYVSSVPGNPLCSENSGVITCTLGEILGGETEQINITLDSDGTSLSSGRTIVTVDGQTQTYEEPYIVKISEPPFAAPGDTVTYTIRLINPTNTTFTDVRMTDIMPDAISITGIEASTGQASFSGQTITYTTPDLTPAERITITVTGELLSDASSPEVVNRACITTAETEVERCASSGFIRASVLPASGESQRGFILRTVGITTLGMLLLFSAITAVYIKARRHRV